MEQKWETISSILAKSPTIEKKWFSEETYVKLTEEDLQTIEKHLQAQATTEQSHLQNKMDTLQKELADAIQTIQYVKEAMHQAFALNGLQEKETLSESIALLGQTCKAYGEKTIMHTSVATNNKEWQAEEESIIHASDLHNQL